MCLDKVLRDMVAINFHKVMQFQSKWHNCILRESMGFTQTPIVIFVTVACYEMTLLSVISWS